MKRKIMGFLALLIALSMILTAGLAMAAPDAGDPAASEAGESAEGESTEGESAEGESADEQAAPVEGESAEGDSAEGESAGEDAAAPAEGESAEGESAEGESTEGASAEGDSAEAAAPVIPNVSYPEPEIMIIPAEGDQIELGHLASTQILEVDGLKFKDMNDNGELDVYEDWRCTTEERIEDLISQMTITEKSRMFYHVCTCGNSNGVDFADARYLWEQDCPFELPPEGDTSPITAGSMSMWYYINVYGITHYLDNTNGEPQLQIKYRNAMQAMGEDTRLGIPITISNDRQYNAWGGMIDDPHDAFGTAHDVELATQLWEIYSKESRAVGIHVVLHPYGQEIGSWNGEDPEYVGTMSQAEINAIQVEDGVFACAKHFIARGGDASYSAAHSEARTVDNWMTAWKLALEANPRWLMTNGYSTGFYDGVHVDYDAETMGYLRNTLGYDGVVVSDWGDQGADNSAGVTADGIVLLDLTIPERYAYTINLGLDQIGSPGTAFSPENPGYYSDCEAVEEAYNQGLITEERLNETCRRTLATKFDLGLFDNPYCDVDKALALIASDAYQQEQWTVTDNASLTAARNETVVELEHQLEAESCVLVKNDDDLLPLDPSYKVYIGSTAAATTQALLNEAFSAYAEVVDDIEAADVVIADCSMINDAAEMVIEDAKDYGKKLVIVTNCTDPTAWVMEQGDAVLFMNFSRPADHGTANAGFILTTEPEVYAQIIYGEREPAGMIVKEIARDSAMDNAQWKDLAGDQGASTYVRLMLLALMKESELNTTPENYGDPLLCYKYGMRYGQHPEFVFDTLVLPKSTTEVTEETSSGTSTSYQTIDGAKAGEPFTVYVLLWNNGADGVTTVKALVDGEEVGEKLMAVNGGSWRIVQMDLTIDDAGEHEITVGDITKTITVE